jgi:hypothetical protein
VNATAQKGPKCLGRRLWECAHKALRRVFFFAIATLSNVRSYTIIAKRDNKMLMRVRLMPDASVIKCKIKCIYDVLFVVIHKLVV